LEIWSCKLIVAKGGSGVKGSLDSPSGDGCGAQIGVKGTALSNPVNCPTKTSKSRALKRGSDISNGGVFKTG